jgi:hypothetical protein
MGFEATVSAGKQIEAKQTEGQKACQSQPVYLQ